MDPALASVPLKTKADPQIQLLHWISFHFISFPEHLSQSEPGLMTYIPSLLKEENEQKI